MAFTFHLPANIQDLSENPDLHKKLVDLWNNASNSEINPGRYMGAFINRAVNVSPNYVDPRIEPPTSTPIAAPWNGFPKAISRWYDDESSIEKLEKAEEVADVLTPILYCVLPGEGGLLEFPIHLMEFYKAVLPDYADVLHLLAQPLREVNEDGSIGDQVFRYRRQQDEYCEWHPSYDANGKLEKLSFTAEPPDYWRALSEVSREKVVELYKDCVDPAVTEDDLFHTKELAAFGLDRRGEPTWFRLGLEGQYNVLNKWTTTHGIMHLTHAANTLGAEVRLAADASLIYATDNNTGLAGNTVPEEIRRIACGGYGGINRSSDPSIGKAVGNIVYDGTRITLTDPIGLYIGNINIDGLAGPNGEPIGRDALTIVRGEDHAFEPRILRFDIKVPDAFDFSLEECVFDARPLKHGGQIARQTTVQLYAQGYPNSADVTVNPCYSQPCENPDRPGVYIGGSLVQCPAADSVAWTRAMPYEGEGGLGSEEASLVRLSDESMSTSESMERARDRSLTGVFDARGDRIDG